MQGKDYNVSYIDNLMVFQAACTRISQIQEVLGKLAEDVTNLIETDTFTGSAADNIKAYAQEVQLPLISSVSTMLTEYQSKLMLYYTGYYDIDDDYSTKFCADTMDKYQQKADKYDNANTAVRDEIAKSLSKISNIIALNTPSQEPLKTDLNWISKKIDILDRLIIEYEDGHSTDLDSLNEFIANINDFITYYNDNINAGEYKSGDVSSCTYAYLLYQSVMLSQEFINGNEAQIQNASDKLNAIGDQMQADYEAACQARVDQGRAELIKGLAVVVVGCLAIAASGGAATPLVGAALFTTGSCTFLYGASNAVEGAQDIYYGMNGDLSSYAYNPIRDTVFMGNQQLYDLWGNANLMIAGTLTAGNQAMLAGMGEGLEGAALAKATSIAVAKNMAIGYLGDKATGATVNFLDERFDLNMTEEALLELGLGIAFDPDTYESLGKVHAKFSANQVDGISNHASGVDLTNVTNSTTATTTSVDTNSHIIGDCDWFDSMDAPQRMRYERWEQTRMDGIDLQDVNDFIFAKDRPTKAEFEAMKLTPVGELTPDQFRQMKIIRESIPGIDDTVTVRKTVPFSDLDNYIDSDNSITGFVAKSDDVKAFGNYGEMRDGLRLDYSYTADDGTLVVPFPEDGNAYGYIEFKVSKDDFIDIPYGDAYGGDYHFDQPFTGNGFTMSNNDFDVPEFYINRTAYPDGLTPTEGQLHLVVDGEDVVVGNWSNRYKKWNYYSN